MQLFEMQHYDPSLFYANQFLYLYKTVNGPISYFEQLH